MSNELITVPLNQLQLFQLEKDRFQFNLEKARFFANSDIVPKQYRSFSVKKVKKNKPNGGYYYEEEITENTSAIGNCLIAIDLALKLSVNELIVMFGMDVIEGKLRPSGKFAISVINSCGRFSKLEWTEEDLGDKTIEYSDFEFINGERQAIKKKISIRDRKFIAFAKELKTGNTLYSPSVTLEIAVKEGWWTKSGSKWPTLTQIMGQRRSASWFADTHCPEILMGMKTIEEEEDIRIIETIQNDVGIFQIDEINENIPNKNDPINNLKDSILKKEKKPKKEKASSEAEIPVSLIDSHVVDAEYFDPSIDDITESISESKESNISDDILFE